MLTAPSQEQPLLISGQHIRDEELVLGSGKYQDNVINSTIERCLLRFVKPDGGGVLLAGTRFANCVIKPATRVQANWTRCAWEDCVFHGHYVGTHFGHYPLHEDDAVREILIRGCDFSRATMHWCIFNRTDVASMKFPSWPSFTLLYPQKNRSAWIAAKLPFKDRFIETSSLENITAIVFHWPTIVEAEEKRNRNYPAIAKRDVSAADPEAVRRALAALDFVRV